VRLPRRTSAQSQQGITQELQSQRAGAITPADRARETTAKYGAISDVADAVGSAFETVADVRREAQESKDEVTYQIGESNLKAARKRLENDPNLKKPVQDDGTSTADYYQQRADSILKDYRDHANNIVGEKARERAGQLIRNNEVVIRADMEGDMGVIETRIAGDELYTGFVNALDGDDIEGARKLIAVGAERLLLDPETAQKWTATVDKQESKTAANDLIANVDEGYSISEEEGNRRLSELIKDTSIDADVKNMAVDGSEEKKVEWSKARDTETKAEEVTSIIAFGNDKLQAGAGYMNYEQADAAFEAGRYGKGVGAANRRNQLFAAITSSIGKMETELNIRETYENGQFMQDDKKHREALSGYEQEVTSEMKGEERITTIGDISRTLGTVSSHTSDTLNLSSKSVDALGQNLKLYRELTSDESVLPALHITGEAAAALEDASLLMDAGVPAQVAAETAYKNKNISPLEKDERAETWRNTAVNTANNSYGELLDSDYYEEPGFGDVDDPPPAMAVEYGAIYKAVYMQTGNEQTAKNIADRAIKSNWVMTNFNSPDPDEYTIEKTGLPGDVHRIRAGIIKDIEVDKYSVQQPDGSYKTTSIDADKIAFVPTDDGRWGIEHGGKPLIRVTDDGIEVASFTLDESRLEEYKEKTAEREANEQRIQNINHETERLEELTASNPYRTVMPGLTTSRKRRVKSLGKEKARLEKDLPTVRF